MGTGCVVDPFFWLGLIEEIIFSCPALSIRPHLILNSFKLIFSENNLLIQKPKKTEKPSAAKMFGASSICARYWNKRKNSEEYGKIAKKQLEKFIFLLFGQNKLLFALFFIALLCFVLFCIVFGYTNCVGVVRGLYGVFMGHYGVVMGHYGHI